MDQNYLKLIKYVGAAADLAEGLTATLKSGKDRITSETIVNLSKFYSASEAVQKILDVIEKDKVSIN